MSIQRLATALLLAATLTTTLGCSGILTGFSGPPIGEVAVESGTPFELEVTSTGKATEVWLIYTHEYQRAKPELLVDLTVSAAGIGTLEERIVLPEKKKRRFESHEDVVPESGSAFRSKPLVELPSVERGETIRIRGTVRPAAGNRMEGARLAVVET